MLRKGEFILAYCNLFQDDPKVAEQVYQYANIRDKEMIDELIQEYQSTIELNPITDDIKVLYWTNKYLFLSILLGLPLMFLGVYAWILLMLIIA